VKTLFLSYAYPPMRYPRAIQVARLASHTALPGLEVVAADEGREVRDDGLLSAAPAAVPVSRVPWGVRARLARALRERTLKDRMLVPDHFRPWAREAARAVLREPRVGARDVLVSFGQPMSDHLAAARIVRRTRAKWIAHFSDPWSDNPFARDGRLWRRVNAWQEAAVVRGADAVVFPSAEMLDLVLGKYPESLAAKGSVLPHAYDEELYPQTPDPGREGRVTMRYVGNFYRQRGPEPLLATLAALHESEPGALAGLRVEFAGRYDQDPLSAPSAGRLPAGLLHSRGPVPYLEALALMRSADLLVLIDAPASRSVFLPSKLIEYLGARRPVLAVTPPGPAASLVREAGGWCADPRGGAAAVGMLRAALRFARERRDGDWGDERAIGRFAAPRVAAELDALVERIAGAKLS
jgi:glycosyltransferase involved in cell wall biosynthesis